MRRDKAVPGKREAGGAGPPKSPWCDRLPTPIPAAKARSRTEGGRQTLRGLQAPPQNGGHLYQGLFSLTAPNDLRDANPTAYLKPVLNSLPGVAAALPSSSSGMRRPARRDLQQNPRT